MVPAPETSQLYNHLRNARQGRESMRFPAPLVASMLFAGLLASCAAEEEKDTEEVEDLSVGEKAALYGMNISVDEAYAPVSPLPSA